jgi:hypothetical protein
MSGYKKIKPANIGAIIRDPVSKTPLNENGEIKVWVGTEGTFWRRRVEEGSCIIIEDEIEKKETVAFDEKNNIIKKEVFK